MDCYGAYELCTPLKERAWKTIGKWHVLPFPVKHTNADEDTECPCLAFIIKRDGETILYMTDWMYCGYNLSPFRINHFLIAVNHTDIPDAENKRHILFGHSSLDTVKDFLLTNMTLDTKTITAVHLSEMNADEDRILQELTDIAPSIVKVSIAKKGMVIEL